MQKFLHLVKYSQLLIRNGLIIEFLKIVWGRFFSNVLYIDVELNIGSIKSPITSRIALEARPIQEKDLLLLSAIVSDWSFPRSERYEAIRRLALLEAKVQTCYVIEDTMKNVRFLQWLILPADFAKLRLISGEGYSVLTSEEGLVEWAYVLPKYRGTGVLPCAAKKILDIASESGIKRIVSMIPAWNSKSLCSFFKIGFKPYQIRIERRLFGIRKRRNILLTPENEDQIIREFLPQSIASLIIKPKY